MQTSTAQLSPEATSRPWCAHDWAEAEGTRSGVGSTARPSHWVSLVPNPAVALAVTLASLTAAAGLWHLRPALRAGEGGALLRVALHVAPLRRSHCTKDLLQDLGALGLTLLEALWVTV